MKNKFLYFICHFEDRLQVVKCAYFYKTLQWKYETAWKSVWIGAKISEKLY